MMHRALAASSMTIKRLDPSASDPQIPVWRSVLTGPPPADTIRSGEAPLHVRAPDYFSAQIASRGVGAVTSFLAVMGNHWSQSGLPGLGDRQGGRGRSYEMLLLSPMRSPSARAV